MSKGPIYSREDLDIRFPGARYLFTREKKDVFNPRGVTFDIYVAPNNPKNTSYHVLDVPQVIVNVDSSGRAGYMPAKERLLDLSKDSTGWNQFTLDVMSDMNVIDNNDMI